MDCKELLTDFFSKTYEKTISMYMQNYSYSFPDVEVLEYCKSLRSISLEQFICFAENSIVCLSSNDVIQFSSFSDCTTTLCDRIKGINDPGIGFIEAGRLLLTDFERTKFAYQKYGENHLKTAEQLGLVFHLYHSYYLTCIGEIINSLDTDFQAKLFNRLIIRTNLMTFIINKKGSTIDLRKEFSFLSDTTYKRRISNVKTLIKHLAETDEYDTSKYFSNIQY